MAGVVGLKPTVGLVSRTGVLPAARSQDSPGPIMRTVYDAAVALQALAGPDPDDTATLDAATPPDYVDGLSPTALSGMRVAVIDSTSAPYPAVVSTIQGLGATTVYLPGLRVPKGEPRSLQDIIAYNEANPVEGLKYRQRELIEAEAVDLSAATAAAYESDNADGRASSRALIDTILNNGTPDDAADDLAVVVVPSGSTLVGIAGRAGYPVLTVPAGRHRQRWPQPDRGDVRRTGLRRGHPPRRGPCLRAGDADATRPERHELEHCGAACPAARTSRRTTAIRVISWRATGRFRRHRSRRSRRSASRWHSWLSQRRSLSE